MQLSNLLKGWIFVILHVLKLLSIVREPWTILKLDFLHFVTNSTGKIKCTTKFIFLLFLKRNQTFHSAFLLNVFHSRSNFHIIFLATNSQGTFWKWHGVVTSDYIGRWLNTTEYKIMSFQFPGLCLLKTWKKLFHFMVTINVIKRPANKYFGFFFTNSSLLITYLQSPFKVKFFWQFMTTEDPILSKRKRI